MSDEKEKDGRPRRGKAKKAEYQTETRKDGGTTYKAQVTDSFGRRKTLRSSSLEQLRAMVSELRRVRSNAKAGLLTYAEKVKQNAQATAKAYSFSEAWERWRVAARHSEAWRSKLRGIWTRHLEPRLGALACHELTGEAMNQWSAWMSTRSVPWSEQKLSGATVMNVWNLVRASIAFAVAAGRFEVAPWGAWRLLQTQEERAKGVGATKAGFQSSAELARGLVAARTMAERAATSADVIPDLHHRLGVMCFLALRRSEAIALSWDHITREADRVVVRIEHAAKEGWRQAGEAVRTEGERGATMRPVSLPKAGKTRRVELDGAGPVVGLLEAQRDLLRSLDLYSPDGPVFPDRRGRYRSRDCIAPRCMRAIAKRAGLERVGKKWDQHSARHSGVRLNIAAGATLAEVMALAGHADPKVTRLYFGDMHRSQTASVADRVAIASPVGEMFAGRGLLPTTEQTAALQAAPLEREERARAAHERYLGRPVVALSLVVDASTVVPATVKENAQKAYHRAYSKARRGGAELPDCAAAGARARASQLAAYASARVRRLKKAAAETECTSAPARPPRLTRAK